MIDQATIEHIKSAANIVDVVGDYVSLRRSGANYKGLCPFHDERTPSFMVSPSKNFCHCFGCGNGGDPIRFLMNLNNFTYREALLHLANKYHIEVKEVEMNDQQVAERNQRQAYLTLCSFAAKHYQSILASDSPEAQAAMDYLNRHGISQASITRFGIGYAPASTLSLTQAISDGGFSISHANNLGLVAPIDGAMRDVMAGCIVIPVIGKTGKEIAFAFQDIHDDNITFARFTSQSAIFSPKDALFAHFQANSNISKQKSCYMTDTPYDAIMMHQAGFTNTVAPVGDLINRYAANDLAKQVRDDSITIITRSMSADALNRCFQLTDSLLPQGINVFCFDCSPAASLGKMLAGTNADSFGSLINRERTDCITFKAQTLIGKASNNNDKLRAIRSVLFSIKSIRDEASKQIYIDVLAQISKIAPNILESELARIKPFSYD